MEDKKIVRIPSNKLLRAANISGKNILIRFDFNVPIEQGKIEDDNRIIASLETLNYVIKKNPKNIYLIAHLDRPGGRFVKSLAMLPIAKELKKLLRLRHNIDKVKLGENRVLKSVYKLSPNIFLLENLRFEPGEEKNDQGFAKEIADIANIYIIDAFATMHRAHASTVAIVELLPTYTGFLVEKEVNALLKIIHNPEHPYIFVIGGAKIEDKMPLIEAVRQKCDHVLVGGKVANEWIMRGHEQGEKVRLPVDGINKKGIIVPVNSATLKEGIFDIGPQTIMNYKKYISSSKTIVWNGSLGMAEEEKFAFATNEIARFIAKQHAEKVILGGDTAGVIDRLRLSKNFDFVSTGGSASTEFLAGKNLPGLEKLLK
ncbi:hypothetical protein COT77_03555 [Candidatus Berkelbacteria bacterium CG10_big_fil_rev_8_21_14_0_10_41_12]|uniref:Phosphoglycerate kinase n=1 Tax=Candidatus Berkelbacteria bacterium CG10_big_fil_rev_8_21_14_0_10_41_12 TaxID=1974513 RepID=A0A2M6WW68_9BACT|nr:MAG: hypothetical protein COT77_03555 [Candidatus Berkelbacteria bacterium CG10_big_fil_rev_8_21_14_0_10_41_12]